MVLFMAHRFWLDHLFFTCISVLLVFVVTFPMSVGCCLAPGAWLAYFWRFVSTQGWQHVYLAAVALEFGHRLSQLRAFDFFPWWDGVEGRSCVPHVLIERLRR